MSRSCSFLKEGRIGPLDVFTLLICLYLLFLPFIRDNFVICYELLDELVDFGYPQTTDGKILQEYITQVGDQFIYNAIEWRHFII